MRLDIKTRDITVSHEWDPDLEERAHLADESNLHELLAVLLRRIKALEAVVRTADSSK